MFGKKQKKQDLEDLPVHKVPEPPKIHQQPEKTQVIEAKLLEQDKSKLLEFLITEFKEQYHGIFSAQDLKEVDSESTSLNLLFAIYGELRIMRMLKEKELTEQAAKK